MFILQELAQVSGGATAQDPGQDESPGDDAGKEDDSLEVKEDDSLEVQGDSFV